MPTALRERPKPFLLPEFCKGCGRRIDACAKDCIEVGREIDPRTGLVPVTLNLEACNGCGLCFDACPEPYGLRPRHTSFTSACSGAMLPRPGPPRITFTKTPGTSEPIM